MLNYRDERNTLSDSARHEAQCLAGAANTRAEQRERFGSPGFDWCPVLNACSEAAAIAGMRSRYLGSMCYRLIQIVESACEDGCNDIIAANEPLIGKYVRLKHAAQAEYEAAVYRLQQAQFQTMPMDEAERIAGERQLLEERGEAA